MISGTLTSLLGCWRTVPVIVAVAVMVAAISRALLVISPAGSLPEERTKEFLLDLDSDTANVNNYNRVCKLAKTILLSTF